MTSGIGWLFDHYFFAGSGEFGDAQASSEPWWLRLHGAAAMAGLIAFGSLFPGHVARAWRLRVNRRTGLLMMIVAATLIVTGWALYYVGDEETRPWLSAAHSIVGIVAGAVLAFHVRSGRRQMRRPKRPAAEGRELDSPACAEGCNKTRSELVAHYGGEKASPG